MDKDFLEKRLKDEILRLEQSKVFALNYRKYSEMKEFMDQYLDLKKRYLLGERTQKLLKEMEDLWI